MSRPLGWLAALLSLCSASPWKQSSVFFFPWAAEITCAVTKVIPEYFPGNEKLAQLSSDIYDLARCSFE